MTPKVKGLWSSGQQSWIDDLQDRVDQLGINCWLVYGACAVALVVLLHVLHWLSGALPVGDFTAPLIFVGIVPILLLAFDHQLDSTALSSLSRFKPVLSGDKAGFEEMEQGLSKMPAAPVLWCQVAGLLLCASVIFFDRTFSGLMRGYLLSDIPLYIDGLFISGMLLVNVYHTLHQLSWVQTIHAHAKNISIIDRAPAFAFSTLTYQTTIMGIILVYGFIYFFPALRQDPVALTLAGLVALLLIVVFILPLQVMHGHLQEDKDRRLTNVRQQLDSTFQTLHERRKAAEFVPSEWKVLEEIAKQLPPLIQEEDYLSKLPTWPWPRGAVGTVVSVAFLPLILLVAQHFVSMLLP